MFHGSELKHKYGSCEVCVCVILLSGVSGVFFPMILLYTFFLHVHGQMKAKTSTCFFINHTQYGQLIK